MKIEINKDEILKAAKENSEVKKVLENLLPDMFKKAEYYDLTKLELNKEFGVINENIFDYNSAILAGFEKSPISIYGDYNKGFKLSEECNWIIDKSKNALIPIKETKNIKVVINTLNTPFFLIGEVYDKLGIFDVTFNAQGCRMPLNKDFGIVSDNPLAYRADEKLIEVIESVGVDKAGGLFTSLKIVEIPSNIRWKILYDRFFTVGEAIYEVGKKWQ